MVLPRDRKCKPKVNVQLVRFKKVLQKTFTVISPVIGMFRKSMLKGVYTVMDYLQLILKEMSSYVKVK